MRAAFGFSNRQSEGWVTAEFALCLACGYSAGLVGTGAALRGSLRVISEPGECRHECRHGELKLALRLMAVPGQGSLHAFFERESRGVAEVADGGGNVGLGIADVAGAHGAVLRGDLNAFDALQEAPGFVQS